MSNPEVATSTSASAGPGKGQQSARERSKNLFSNLMPCFKKNQQEEEQREFIANDETYNAQFNYAVNKIKTSRYTWYNFLVKNLYEQLHRRVNIYFICLTILQFIPQISSLNPTTTLIPIIFVLAITAIKDAHDDLYRHKSDRSVNKRKVQCLRTDDHGQFTLVENEWEQIKVGDILCLSNNEPVPTDLLLLSSCDENGLVYVETAELDGETNLKVRQTLPGIGAMKNDLTKFGDFKGKVLCEAPNNILHRFTGNLYLQETCDTLPIDNQNILLRGCTIRNTVYCFGWVIFAGPDTKLMQNTGISKLKRTNIDLQMNDHVLVIFIFLGIVSVITAIANVSWESRIGHLFTIILPDASYMTSNAFKGFLTFWSYAIILNTVVPISLYVSIEFIRLGQSYFINSDQEMYYAHKNIPAKARTTTLNEELGQVEYIFSDKTGTLTQNIMVFNKCSINGTSYGALYDEQGIQISPDEKMKTVDFSGNAYHEPHFRFYDQRLADAASGVAGDEHLYVAKLFRLLAICHTVMPDSDDEGQLVYQAQSPDEGALVSAARNFGFVFKSRTFDSLTVIENGVEFKYKVLAILDFDNIRKRMSVIVEDTEGNITLYCKGADTVIYDRLAPPSGSRDKEVRSKTSENLDEFAREGLRTLCLAVKNFTRDEYLVWEDAYTQANRELHDREDRLSAVYEEAERDLELVGATAIEDKLQDGVPETIENLCNANIKIWVLTGDKQETAVNIGYSCNMLTDSMKNVFVINGQTDKEVEGQIDDALRIMAGNYPGSSRIECVSKMEADDIDVAAERLNALQQSQATYGLVINGYSLTFALESNLDEKFLDFACKCSAIICCRVTPLQKAKVVTLVKDKKKAITLAIGDGANDVSMIKAAHIGIGISGEEGTQAVLSSDFSFGQFRYLERLLLVHGRWSYMRICKFLNYFFYKNFAFTLIHFWYGPFTGFTAQSAYDSWFVTCYNIFYTSQPILWLAVLEQDLNPEFCVRFPRLYLPGQRNELFNTRIFIKSIVRGIVTSLVIFFINYGVFSAGISSKGIDRTDYQTFSQALSTSLIMVVTLQVALDTSFWTFLNIFFTFGSIGVYFMFSYALYSKGLYSFIPSQFPFIGSATTSFQLPALWFSVLLTTTVCILPAIIRQYIMRQYMPTYADEVLALQSCERAQRRAARSNEPGIVGALTHRLRNRFPLRRRSSASRSKSQSGYAFSHERGFGDLITTGRMSMRRRPPIASIIPGISERGTVRAVSIVSETSCHSPATGASSPAAAIPTTLPGVDVSMTSSRDSQTIVA